MRVSEVLKAKQRKILTVGSDDVVKTASSWIAQAGEGLAVVWVLSDFSPPVTIGVIEVVFG